MSKKKAAPCPYRRALGMKQFQPKSIPVKKGKGAKYSRKGRGYPDLSSIAINISV